MHHPRRSRRTRVLAVLAVSFLTVTLDAALADPGRPAAAGDRESVDAEPAPRPLVVLWGDSLAWEAQDAFAAGVADGAGAEVRLRTFGGTALCDWLPEMKATAEHEQVTVAVLEFSGNALTPCMRDAVTGSALTGDDYLEAYAQDLDRALAILGAGGTTAVYLVGAPPPRDGHEDGPGSERVRDLYRRAARAHPGTTYVPAGQAVLDDGRWTATLPCLPSEGPARGCTDGRIPVRAADGVHFCPATAPAAAGVVDRCPVWSSGAFRFGTAMAEPVRHDLLRRLRS